jgi:hypothetical protein
MLVKIGEEEEKKQKKKKKKKQPKTKQKKNKNKIKDFSKTSLLPLFPQFLSSHLPSPSPHPSPTHPSLLSSLPSSPSLVLFSLFQKQRRSRVVLWWRQI